MIWCKVLNHIAIKLFTCYIIIDLCSGFKDNWNLRVEINVLYMLIYAMKQATSWVGKYPRKSILWIMHSPGIAHSPGMAGNFSPPPRVSDPDMRAVMHARIAN